MTILSQSKCTLSNQIKRSKVLRVIREQNRVTRDDVAKATGLSIPVVSRITRELIDKQFIQEIGKEHIDSEGRKPALLGMKQSANFMIGLDIGAWETKGVLTNFENQIIHRHAALTPLSPSGDAMIDFLKNVIHTLLAEGQVAANQLRGIGFAVGGNLDLEAGKVLYFCNIPSMNNLDLVSPIRQEFRVPVHLTNAQAMWTMAECEKARTDGQDKDFMMAFCSNGLALISLIEGRSPIGLGHTGCRDLGHVTIDNTGPLCHCGLKGCLEAYASGWAIESQARELCAQGVLEGIKSEIDAITARDVFNAGLRGNPICLKLVREAGTLLGQTLSYFIDYHNPRRIIFAGGLITNSTLYLDAVIDALRRRMAPERFERLKLQTTSLDKYAGALGTTYMLTNKILNAPIEDLIQVSW